MIILGDFNETKPPGDTNQSLAVLLQTDSHLHDAFEFAKGRVRTHANGNTYDRLILSDALMNGSAA